MTGKPPAFQFYAKDWLTDDKVNLMSLAAQGLYMRLLAAAWLRGGSIPSDESAAARLVGVPLEEFRELWPEVRPCWNKERDLMVMRRLRSDFAALLQRKRNLSAAGKSGNRKRWGSGGDSPGDRSASASAKKSPTDSSSDVAPATPTQTTLKPVDEKPPAPPQEAGSAEHPPNASDARSVLDAIEWPALRGGERFRPPEKARNVQAAIREFFAECYRRDGRSGGSPWVEPKRGDFAALARLLNRVDRTDRAAAGTEVARRIALYFGPPERLKYGLRDGARSLGQFLTRFDDLAAPIDPEAGRRKNEACDPSEDAVLRDLDEMTRSIEARRNAAP